MRKSIFLIISLLFHYLLSDGQTLNFSSLTSQQGLSHSTVYSIAQDNKGFIWIGTREGLNRFDSRTIKNYYVNDTNNKNNSNEIRALVPYKKNLYIGTGSGMYMYDEVLDSIVTLHANEKTGSVNHILVTGNELFICADNGFYRIISGNTVKKINNIPLLQAAIGYEKGSFLVASINSLMLINFAGKTLKTFTAKELTELSNPSFVIYEIYKDSDDLIWIGTARGVFTYKKETGQFQKINLAYSSIEVNTVRTITEGSKNKIWIGTEAGLFIYDKQTFKSNFYTQSFNRNESALTDKSIYSSFTGKDGVVWIGTYFGGVNYASSIEKGFYKILPSDKKNGLSGKAVSQIIQDDNGTLWIGTEDGGITLYNRKQNTFDYIKHQEGVNNSISINNIHAIHDDKAGNIWIGTFMGGLNKYNSRTKKFTVYRNDFSNKTSLSNNLVYAVYKDSKKTLWAGTQSGLNIYNYKKDNFSQFRPEVFKGLFIYDIIEDQNSDLWFCTRNTGIFQFIRKSNSIVHYSTNSIGNKKISSDNIISVYRDSENNLWFGTFNGGLLKYNGLKRVFSAMTMDNGLPNNTVYGILEDADKMIWISTNKGLSKINPHNNTVINYNNMRGLPSNQFNPKSFFKDKDGYLYFGSINGLCYFNERSVTEQALSPIHFTSFKLFNKEIKPGPNSILEKQIDEVSEIPLTYKDNVITIDFVALNYTSGHSNYAYYLEGFERSWNYAGSKRSVTYTNLSPGKYTFHVKNSTEENSISNYGRQLLISVSSPFYLTKWAYFFYLIIFLLSVYAYSYFIKLFHKQKLAVQLERLEKEKMREINDHRLNFFVFISHEFKTPLTLILASIDKMANDFSDLLKKTPELAFVKNNATRLYGLIEQLMEFRKIDSDYTKVGLQKLYLKNYLTEIFNAFIPLYEKKHLNHVHQLNLADHGYFFDADKVDKIILNVLSNAVKNTPKNGLISVSVEMANDLKDSNRKNLIFKFSDNGRGMDAGQLAKVYQLFYKSEESGSGIGMALVKSLVDLLNGKITIESEVNKGTEVTVILPVYLKLSTELKKYSSTKILRKEGLPQALFTDDLRFKKEAFKLNPETIYTILIAEDNKELLHFLARHLSNKYKVITATSGSSALTKIRKSLPDLIVSDVNMPKMDGIELCKFIKSNSKINHIPVILLSENANEDSRVDGLNVGADAYLCKPFHLKELELILNNIINSRMMIREQFEAKNGTDKLPRNNKNEDFLNKLTVFVEGNYANPNLSIQEIAGAVGMGRSLLHIKLKKLLNQSATEFLNDYRINKAKFLLENDLPVFEVAYFTGFSDPNYFSRVFKKHLNTSPKLFKEKLVKIKQVN